MDLHLFPLILESSWFLFWLLISFHWKFLFCLCLIALSTNAPSNLYFLFHNTSHLNFFFSVSLPQKTLSYMKVEAISAFIIISLALLAQCLAYSR